MPLNKQKEKAGARSKLQSVDTFDWLLSKKPLCYLRVQRIPQPLQRSCPGQLKQLKLNFDSVSYKLGRAQI